MVEPINLNKARKARDKALDKSAAAANRARFGRTKAEKAADKRNADVAARKLDGARRETDD
jgi:hypothetical protein